MTDAREALAIAIDVVQRDGILLDERRWDEWLDLYAPDCVFWAPMWRNETELVESSDEGLSHFYYEDRRGLEDRLLRIRSGKSPASNPLPRTAHMAGNVALTAPPEPERIDLRATWTCHVLLLRARAEQVYFGRAEYSLAASPAGWKIRRKKVVLLNDTIKSLVDIYCV